MTFPKFDPNLGVLTGIEFTLVGQLEGTAKFESLDSQAAQVIVGMESIVRLQRPDTSQILISQPSAQAQATVASYDGLLDYVGTSGATYPRLVGVDIAESQTITTPADLALFSGAGAIDLPVVTSGAAAGRGAGNIALSYITTASAAVTVTYHFEQPAITIKKYTNGEDADVVTGPMLQVNDPVTWTYIITNTGALDLIEVTLSDDREGAITCPQTALAIGEAMLCTHIGIAKAGQYSNTGTVTGKTIPDANNVQRTVTDSDPSHYIASTLAQCPTDINGVLSLPNVQYLGQGANSYELPTGFEKFIVKRYVRTDNPPFSFNLEIGMTNANGQRIYVSPAGTPRPERVWACAGECTFIPHLDGEVKLGYLVPGLTIGAVVIDDDNDARLNSWLVDGNVNNPYQTITDQQMVEYLSLDVPFAGHWSYLAKDSIGMVAICVVGDATALQVKSGMSNGRQDPLPTDQATTPVNDTPTSKLYLPAVYANQE